MNDSPADSVFVGLLCILRCVVPLLVLFGVSYLLRRLGLVAETPAPPDEERKPMEDSSKPEEQTEGVLKQ